MNKWLEWMHSDEYEELAEAEEKFFEEHWANDLLDAPHALIAMIETKIARAVIAREREIIGLLEGLAYTDEQGHEMISEFKSDLIALLQGEHCQDCEKGSCKPHYIAPKTYIIKGEKNG